MAFRLEIPASAFEIKAAFFTRPNTSTVNLIHEHIHRTGCPHLWSGHNGWADQPHSPVQIHLMADDTGFYVGRDARSHLFLKWPDHFWKTLKTLEPLSKSAAA